MATKRILITVDMKTYETLRKDSYELDESKSKLLEEAYLQSKRDEQHAK
ncbi:hypothetical protein [Priestia megaterium]|nr:hypothetical protein [Priestia megaterium]MED4278300.1 hypothetical protein [Priestia megaterium]MED4314405.1 hypothetical protein [Priestia megaterium]